MSVTKNRKRNVKLKQGFKQVCVLTDVKAHSMNLKDIEQRMKNLFGIDVQVLEVIVTGPDIRSARPVPGTGGRRDVFFAIKHKDCEKFATLRLQFSKPIMWVEDVLAKGNYTSPIYPERVKAYQSWYAEYEE